MQVFGSNIAIGLYVLHLWSELCVPYVSVEVKYSYRSVCTGHVVSVVFHMWVLGFNIAVGLCIIYMWSVLFVPYVGGWI